MPRHSTGWTGLRQALDRYLADVQTRGRRRRNVSSTHRPAYPFNRK